MIQKWSQNQKSRSEQWMNILRAKNIKNVLVSFHSIVGFKARDMFRLCFCVKLWATTVENQEKKEKLDLMISHRQTDIMNESFLLWMIAKMHLWNYQVYHKQIRSCHVMSCVCVCVCNQFMNKKINQSIDWMIQFFSFKKSHTQTMYDTYNKKLMTRSMRLIEIQQSFVCVCVRVGGCVRWILNLIAI